MKLFVWEDVRNLTQNYHSGGGAVVIAESLEAAEQALTEIKGIAPDFECEMGTDAAEHVFIFPDAGCC